MAKIENEIIFDCHWEEIETECSRCDTCEDLIVGKTFGLTLTIRGNVFSTELTEVKICEACKNQLEAF